MYAGGLFRPHFFYPSRSPAYADKPFQLARDWLPCHFREMNIDDIPSKAPALPNKKGRSRNIIVLFIGKQIIIKRSLFRFRT